jgi:hypothetical protein
MAASTFRSRIMSGTFKVECGDSGERFPYAVLVGTSLGNSIFDGWRRDMVQYEREKE